MHFVGYLRPHQKIKLQVQLAALGKQIATTQHAVLVSIFVERSARSNKELKRAIAACYQRSAILLIAARLPSKVFSGLAGTAIRYSMVSPEHYGGSTEALPACLVVDQLLNPSQHELWSRN